VAGMQSMPLQRVVKTERGIKMLFKKSYLIFLVFFCVSFMAKGDAQIDKILSDMEQKTKDVNSIQTRFIQTKKLAVFTKEITIEGMVYIKKPNLFAWHVYKPVFYGLVVEGNEISQWDSDTNQVQTISMKNNPAFNAIFEQMNGWLSGKYHSFMGDYNISVVNENPLTLKFIPLKSAVSHKFIKSITIFFDKDPRYIKKFIIDEKNGDQTVLSFLDTKLNSPIPANAWQAAFNKGVPIGKAPKNK
jgi:chaperone LolA